MSAAEDRLAKLRALEEPSRVKHVAYLVGETPVDLLPLALEPDGSVRDERHRVGAGCWCCPVVEEVRLEGGRAGVVYIHRPRER